MTDALVGDDLRLAKIAQDLVDPLINSLHDEYDLEPAFLNSVATDESRSAQSENVSNELRILEFKQRSGLQGLDGVSENTTGNQVLHLATLDFFVQRMQVNGCLPDMTNHDEDAFANSLLPLISQQFAPATLLLILEIGDRHAAKIAATEPMACTQAAMFGFWSAQHTRLDHPVTTSITSATPAKQAISLGPDMSTPSKARPILFSGSMVRALLSRHEKADPPHRQTAVCEGSMKIETADGVKGVRR